MRVGFARQIRLVDKLTNEKYGTDSLVLMHNAAKSVLDAILQNNIKGNSVCILCGKGNNAGDGFALAQMLSEYFDKITVSLLYGRDFSKDAAHYFSRLSSQINIIENEVCAADIYVDAIFGTGFSGELPEQIVEVLDVVNQSPSYKIAIDIPTGVNADTGSISDGAFFADMTVTFQILKFAHILAHSAAFCGKLVVSDIGLSEKAMEEADISAEWLYNFTLPTKNPMIHKGNNGTLFSIVGSRKYQGAATLSIMSSLRGGCGIVEAFVPKSIYIPLAAKINSAILLQCSEDEDGELLSASINTIQQEVSNRAPTAILIGSGMGLGEEQQKIVEHIAKGSIPCVVDGDGLRYLPKQAAAVKIITPHIGEFARLVGLSIEEIKANRFEICKEFALKHNLTLVLKDCITVITSSVGKQWVLSRTNAGMAKGGSGDVLAGLIASFLAQGFAPETAACAGVYYHSLAGQIALQKKGEYAMLPEDLINYLPLAFQQL